MKKTVWLLLLLTLSLSVKAAECKDGPYGLQINGTKVVEATAMQDKDLQGRTQYKVSAVELAEGDEVQLINISCAATWMVDLDPYGAYEQFEGGSATNKLICGKAAIYDFYIKLSASAGDLVYVEEVGSGSGCQDGPYGIEVKHNDSIAVFPAVATGEPDTEGRVQYKAQVKLMMGDTCKLANLSCDSRWMVDIDPYDAYVDFKGGKAAGYVVALVSGCYDFYIKMKSGDDVLYIGYGEGCSDPKPVEPCPEERTTYATSAPAECPDVMLQGFYWDSYHIDGTYAPDTKKYGDTKWATLLPDASEIGAYFDMVWLPPSAKSDGGVGYGPAQYSNQTSAWGSRSDLIKLINALHAQNTKVIADVVINHTANKTSWCNFYENDFGCYGKFSPTAAWICKTDEMNSDPKAKDCLGAATGANDDGYGDEANYAAARDWDHQNQAVRNMFKAYLKYLKNYVGYDGWRYDYCKGFHNSHINDYNAAAGNYFSVMEYWDGNVETLKSHLSDANWNTCTFDFATKYEALNRGIAAGNYNGCKGCGLLGAGRSRYAVTFVDSHDSFSRDDNEFLGKGNSMKNNDNKNKVLQANAFILSMPGVPCVFYPHWKDSYTGPFIRQMIDARHLTGVHSESAVSDEASNGGYKATVTGKNGSLVLLLGDKASQTVAGYTKFVDGVSKGFAIWIKENNEEAPHVFIQPGSQRFTDNVNGIQVTLAATGSLSAVDIYYTIDGTTPSKSSLHYTQPFTIKETTTVKAIAYAGTKASSVQEATFTYKEAKTPITVRMAQPDEWKDVYLFAWTADGKGTNILGGWPGTPLTLDADGWYAYTFDETVKEINFIFNNGGKGEQTADLYTTYDVCYIWTGECEVEDEECSAPVTDFKVILSPGSKVFKDAEAGVDITMTVIGSGEDNPTIYYTLDGTEPTALSTKSTVNPTLINIKQTTTVKALAIAGDKQSEVVMETYTYKASQNWPITVTFDNAGNWKVVNLYSWGTDAAQTKFTGEWPGSPLTKDASGVYKYTFDASIKEVNLIFNDGSTQSSDLYTDEDACYSWGDDTEKGGKNAILVDCTAPDDLEEVRSNANHRTFMKDGSIYIQCDNLLYNIMGERVMIK